MQDYEDTCRFIDERLDEASAAWSALIDAEHDVILGAIGVGLKSLAGS